ncbi:MAG: arginase family protein, partial [Bdellovibrionales bacterium]|nr:arginase family protein [Bdellovibrionales bacterium]
GRFTVTLGGDHSLSIASLAAALKIYPDLRVLWIDAHADINTPSSSPSGNLHGMPVAALLGLFDLSYRSEFSWLKPSLKAQQIAYLGVRDLDLGEKKTLSDLKIATYTSKDVQNLGIKSLFAKIKAELGIQADTPTYTSLDFDGLDPSQAPATGLRVPHGIKLSDFLKLIQLTKSQSHWIGSDLVEFNPFMARSQSEMLTTLSTAESFFDLLPWQANKLEPRLKILPSLLMKEELSNQSQVSFRRGWQTKFNSCMF